MPLYEQTYWQMRNERQTQLYWRRQIYWLRQILTQKA
jgi:hypothetical protein